MFDRCDNCATQGSSYTIYDRKTLEETRDEYRYVVDSRLILTAHALIEHSRERLINTRGGLMLHRKGKKIGQFFSLVSSA